MNVFEIPDVVFTVMFFIFGVFLIFYSRHKGSFEKTAKVHGFDVTKKIFRKLKFGGYVLLAGSVIHALL